MVSFEWETIELNFEWFQSNEKRLNLILNGIF